LRGLLGKGGDAIQRVGTWLSGFRDALQRRGD
jgi:oleate hydratase